MAINYNQGIRIALNSGDVSQVRKDFENFVKELQKEADNPIDFNINSTKLKDDLKQNVSSIQDAINQYKKLGDVIVKPKFDAEGNLEKFKLTVKEVDGMISELNYKVKGYTEKGGKLFSMPETGFALQDVSQIDKTKEKLNELKQAENELLKAEQQLANQMGQGREQAYNQRISKEQELIDSQNKLEQSEKKRQENITKNEGASIIKNINDQSKAYNDLLKTLGDLEKKAQSVSFIPNSKQSDINGIRNNISGSLSDLSKGILPDENKIRQTTDEIGKLDRAIQNMITKDIAEGNRRQKFYDDYIDKQKELNKLTLESIKSKDPNSNEEVVRQERILKLTQEISNMKNSDSGYYKKVVASDSEFKDLMQSYNYQKQLTDAKVRDIEVTRQQNELSKEQQRVASLGTKIGNLPKGQDILNDKSKLDQYIQSLYNGNATIKNYTESTDKMGNSQKKLSVELQGTGNKLITEKLIIDENTNALYKNSTAINDASNKTMTLGEKLKNTLGSMTSFISVTGAIYASIRQLKEGVSIINDINKAQTDIRLITGKSREEVVGLTKDYSNMASELKTTTTEVMKGASEFLRAGNDVKQTQNLLKASTIGSAVSGQSNQQMAEELIAIANGFKMATNDAKEMNKVIDVMSTLDNNSATSMAEIAQAIQRTASSAQNAGTKFEQLSTYIATVSSITRKSSESIGESFKTIFARIQNVKLGKALDDEGQVISDVEASLKKVGLNLRDTKNSFKDFPIILKELRPIWNGLTKNNDQLTKSMIANSIAGVRQRENFLVLMDNLSTVDDLTQKVATSTGSAEDKFNSAYKESTVAKINEFKNEVQKLWQTMLSSDAINSFVEMGTKAVKTLKEFINMSTTSKVSIVAWAGAIFIATKMLITFVTESSKMGKSISLMDVLIKTLIPSLAGATSATAGFTSAMVALKSAMSFLFLTPQGLAIMALLSGLALATGAIMKHSDEQKKLKQRVEESKGAINSLNESLKNMDRSGIESGIKKLEADQKKLEDLTKKKIQLEKDLKNLATEEVQVKYGGGDVEGKIKSQISALTNDIKKEIDILKESGYEVDNNTNSINQLTEAKSKLSLLNTAQKIEEETKAQFDQKNEITALWQEYNHLISMENQSAEVKARVSQISEILKGKLQGVTVATDEQGRVVIANNDLVSQQIGKLNEEGLTLESLTSVKLQEAKNHESIEIDKTRVTFEQVNQRIAKIQQESRALLNAKNDTKVFADALEGSPTGVVLKGKMDLIDKQLEEKKKEYDKWNDAFGSFEKAFTPKSSGIRDVNTGSMSSGGGYEAYDKEKGKKSKKSDAQKAEEMKDIQNKVSNYLKEEEAIKRVTEALQKNKSEEENLYGDALIAKKKENIQLLIQQSQLTDELTQKKQKDMKASEGLLQSLGLNAQNGTISNYKEVLDSKIAWANNQTTVSGKKEGYQFVRQLEEEIKKYFELSNSVTSLASEHQKLATEVQKVNLEIMNINLGLKEDSLKPMAESAKELNSQLSQIEINENSKISTQIDKHKNKLDIEKQVLQNMQSQTPIYKDMIAYLTQQLTTVEKGSKAWDEINNKLESAKDKLRANTDEIKKQNETIRQSIIDTSMKITEEKVYDGISKRRYEDNINSQINAKKAYLDKLKEENDLEKEKDDRNKREEEIRILQEKFDVIRLGKIKDITDAKAKELDLELEKEKALDREREIQEKLAEYEKSKKEAQEEYNKKLDELTEKQKNLMNNNTVRTFGKTKDGIFDFFYGTDSEDLDKINKDIKETTDDFNKKIKDMEDKYNKEKISNEQKYKKEMEKLKDNLEDNLKKKQQEFDLWEAENQRQKNEKKIQQEIENLENQKTVREEFLNRTRLDLEEALSNEENLYSISGGNIMSIVEKSLNNLNGLYDDKFKDIISTIAEQVSRANYEMSKLNTFGGNEYEHEDDSWAKDNSEMNGDWANERENNRSSSSSSSSSSSNGGFDEKTYLELNPDVAQEIERGKNIYGDSSTIKSAKDHYERFGQYEGRQIAKFDEGGFTGEWGKEGKLAILHEKEWTANKIDTNNLLKATETLKNVSIPDVMNNMISKMIPNFKIPDMSNIIQKSAPQYAFSFSGDLVCPNVKDGDATFKALYTDLKNNGFAFMNRDK